jgi:hypothetical protein
MLTHGKDIAIRIFEPRYLNTCGRRPNSEFTILSERILFEVHAPILKPGRDRPEIVDFPAQDRALKWGEVRHFGDPNLVPADTHDQSRLTKSNPSLPS